MKKILLAIVPVLFVVACSTTNTPPSCNSVSGTQICLGGELFSSFDQTYWEVVGSHIEVEFEPTISGSTTRAVGMVISLYSSVIDTTHVPYTGDYVNTFDATSDSLQFYVIVTDVNQSTSQTTTYISDLTVGTNILHITSFVSNVLSGNGSLTVKNQSTNEQKTLLISFENFGFQ